MHNKSSRYCHGVRLSGIDMHCGHMVHVSADLSLWLFWAPWNQSMSTQPSFSSSTWKRGGCAN